MWTWSYGATVLATDERGVFNSSGRKDTRTFLIAALPLSLGYDGSDSLLDPTRGFRLSGRISPELSAHSGQLAYARTQIDASAYRPIADGIVAAGRIRLGTIIGAGVYDIAPSRRFYSGGGGSVRGYGYQDLGPKDMDGDPIGGRGLAEFALETRIRLKQLGGNFGIVPFLDGGSLSTEALARLQELALRRRPRRALLFELRANPHRCRRPAQPPEGRRPVRGHRLPRPGLLARGGGRSRRRGAAPGAPAAGLAASAARRAARAVHRAADHLRRRPDPSRHGAGAPLHHRPASRRSRRRRVSRSESAASTVRSSASRSSGTSPSSDARGIFLTSPEIDLDWTPGAWLANKLHIDSVTADRVNLIRLPKLRPSLKHGPILPGFDIHVGELAVRHLEVGPQVAGQQWRGRVAGKADVRSGRALVELAASLDGGDRLVFKLDARARSRSLRSRRPRRLSGQRCLAGAGRHSSRHQSQRRRQRQLDALARQGRSRPLRPPDGAAGAWPRQGTLSRRRPVEAGAVPDRPADAADLACRHGARIGDLRRPGRRRTAGAGLASAPHDREGRESISRDAASAECGSASTCSNPPRCSAT